MSLTKGNEVKKEILNIIPINKDNYDCFQSTLISMAEYWEKDYQCMFADSWGFDYNENKSTFAGKIDADNFKNVRGILSDIHGIDCIWDYASGYEEAYMEILTKFRNNLNYIISIDSFYCPWHTGFNKIHIDHYCIVLKIDEQTKEITCLDPYSSVKHETLSFEILKKGYLNLIFIRMELKGFVTSAGLKKLLLIYGLKVLNTQNKENAFVKMKKLANDISNNFELKNEIQGDDNIHSNLLLYKLKLLENGRINFSCFLSYIRNKYTIQDLNKFENEFLILAKSWSKLRLFLMKIAMKSTCDNYREQISDRIRAIAENEEKIAIELKECADSL